MPRWSVEAPGWQDEPLRTVFHDWLREHGLAPELTRYVETDVVDMPLLRAEVYDLTIDDCIKASRAGAPVVHVVEVALKSPPPVRSWP
jgi:hypothetical protein